MTTLVYTDDGEHFIGEQPDKPLSHWKKFRRTVYMYKGYRYCGINKCSVVVYTDKKWDIIERKMRRDNGFLRIHEHKLQVIMLSELELGKMLRGIEKRMEVAYDYEYSELAYGELVY